MILPLILLLQQLFSLASGHGLLYDPQQRGLFRGHKFAPGVTIDRSAPYDPYAHFPAGDKDSRPGAGKLSQERAVGFNWKPFEPTTSSYKWQAGVCGDPKGGTQHHLKGGKYYYGAKIAKTYQQGGVLEAKISIVAHHNGFVQFHVCDVAKCGGEISEKCFRDGHCKKLMRTLQPSCESRIDMGCAPRDPKYPGRWFMPCTTGKTYDTYGGSKMQFRLPENLSCEHCVLHWRWVGANGCNPPGVVEYFRGPRGPKWGNCRGAGGAIGGYTSVQKPCAGRKFAEEYYQCADIRIEPKGGIRSQNQPTEPKPVVEDKPVTGGKMAPIKKPEPTNKPNLNQYSNQNGSPVRYIAFVADGKIRRRVSRTMTINTQKWSQMTFEAVTERVVPRVEFFIDGRKLWTDYHRPYFMMGNSGRTPNYWKTPVFNKMFKLQAQSEGKMFTVYVTLRR